MCGGLAGNRLDEAPVSYSVPDGGNAYQHAVYIVNGINVDQDTKDHEIADFLQIRQKSSSTN